MKNKKNIFLVSPSPIDGYPPVQHQASILAEKGYSVYIFTSNLIWSNLVNFSYPGVSIISVSIYSVNFFYRQIMRLKYILLLTIFRFLKTPLCEISYDPNGLFFSRICPFKPKIIIAHLHEMLLDNKKTFYERFAVKMLKKLSTVIVADKNRAFFLHRQIKLDIFPHVVRNVPFLRNEIKCNVSNKNKKFSTVYIGSISDNQAIDKIIMSMVYWPSDIFFHIYGIAKHEIVEKLISLARSLGVDSQIKFEGWVAYPSIINKINKHSLGFSFYLPTQKNHIYSAGASNKRYQYMQAGIPQVSDNSMGTFELIQGNNIGLSVSPESPIDIANAVNFFYKNPNICVEYGARSRKLVEEKYNYDLEFKPIVNIIESKSNVAC